MAEPTRDKVLNAAAEIFAERGFEQATVREICTAAGVNLASVNYHFGDKEALYLQTVQRAHQLKMERVPPPSWPPGTPPEHKLFLFVLAILNRMLGGSELDWGTRLLMREMMQPTIAGKPIVEEFIRPQLQILHGILDELVPADTASHRRHQIAFSVIGQCLHYRAAGHFVALLIPKEEQDKHYSIEQLARHITDFSLSALGRFHTVSRPEEPQSSMQRRNSP